jgi:N4-gp56 family major capsid protein
MRETSDELTRNMLASTASQINCQFGGGTDNPTPLSGPDLDEVLVALIGNRAMMVSDAIPGSLKFGTAPVRDAFWGLMHSDLIPSLQAINGFISSAQYPAAMNVLNYEWGSYQNFRFLYSSGGSVSPNASALGQDVYNTFLIGKESYACIDLTEATAEFIYTPPGGPGDPLRQRQTCGFKMAQVPRLLNDAWLYNLRSTRL